MDTADYWLRTFVRYFHRDRRPLPTAIIKLFALQMYFPVDQSACDGPLATSCQCGSRGSLSVTQHSTRFFRGLWRRFAGLLLLNRRTITLGLLVAAGVFTNVVLLNLSYDIPVKIFSIHISYVLRLPACA